jgi:hypothetical protein
MEQQMIELLITNYKLPIKKVIMAVLLTACVSSCGMLFYHDPQKAREEADRFIHYVYIDGNFTEAYKMVDADFDKNFGFGYLEKISDRFVKMFSKLEGIRADNYMYEQGERAITLLYSGLSEKAPSYHKIVMTGDAQHGYKISSIIYSDVPFQGYRTMKPFK